MGKLSQNTELVVNKLFEHYNSDTNSPKEFSDLECFGFTSDEMAAVFLELEKYALAVPEKYDDGTPYLYINYGLVQYKELGILADVLDS